jgi:hypothetical protein
MGKFASRSKDQKRKAKLKLRANRSSSTQSLAYSGNKYKTAQYVLPMMYSERGILEAYVLMDRALTDAQVEDALEHLIVQMRAGSLPPFQEAGALEGNVCDLIIWRIRSCWQSLAQRQPLPSREELIGILRTILHSLALWRSKSLHAQGYLHFLEPFLKKAGFTVTAMGSEIAKSPSRPMFGETIVPSQKALVETAPQEETVAS